MTKYLNLKTEIYAENATEFRTYDHLQDTALTTDLNNILGARANTTGVYTQNNAIIAMRSEDALNRKITQILGHLQTHTLAEYRSDISYAIYNTVREANGTNVYLSLVNDNLGNVLTDNTKWKLITDLNNMLPLATETIPGIIQIATQDETNAKTNNTKAVTPLKLGSFLNNIGFANSKTTNGYTYLPNGLILQWGENSTVANATGVAIILPVAYPNANLVCYATSRSYPANNAAINSGNKSLSGFNITSYSPGGSYQSSPVSWFSIGY